MIIKRLSPFPPPKGGAALSTDPKSRLLLDAWDENRPEKHLAQLHPAPFQVLFLEG